MANIDIAIRAAREAADIINQASRNIENRQRPDESSS